MKAFAPNGKEIVATADTVPGNALVSEFRRAPDGSLDIDHSGETKMCWDGQTTTRDDRGQRVFVDSAGNEWPEDAIHLEGEQLRAILPAAPATAEIFVTEAEHFSNPGRPIKAHLTRAIATAEAVELINIMLKDNGDPPTATAQDWEMRLEKLQDEHGAAHCFVEIHELPVHG